MQEFTTKDYAHFLLENKIANFNFENYFTYTSGLKGPFYCDNRLLMSYPLQRELAIDHLVQQIREEGCQFDAVLGMATAGIAPGMLLADKLHLPFYYLRAEAKQHGTKKLIEGAYKEGERVLLFDDVINLGGSIFQGFLKAKEAKLNVAAFSCLFNYETDEFKQKFKELGLQVPVISLMTYRSLVEEAVALKVIQQEQIKAIFKNLI